MDENSGLPRHLPTYSTDLVEQLDKLNPPVVVEKPLHPDELAELAFQAGRRSLVDELLRAKDAPRN